MDDAKRFEELRKKEDVLRRAASIVSVAEGDLPKTIERFLNDIAKLDNKKNQG